MGQLGSIGLALVCFAASFTAGCAVRKSAGNSLANAPPAKDWTVTAAWKFDFTNFMPCNSTVMKGCVSGFTWGYLQGAAQVPLKTSAASVCTSTSVGGAPPQPETCTDTTNATLGIGPVTFYVTANYVDNMGTSGSTSADESAEQNVGLVPPIGLSVSWQ